MTEQHVIEILKIATRTGIALWLDGGWGVDALAGQQTRLHNDVDVVIEHKNEEAFVNELVLNGYCEEKTDYSTPSHSVWKTVDGRIVDLHLIDFDDAGIAHYENDTYPEGGLDGKGEIGGVVVRCVSPEAQILFHQGYKHDDNDVHDVLLLCEMFGFAVPDEYK
jgi:lincosamide nucleotidyltransferase A/C/D/E